MLLRQQQRVWLLELRWNCFIAQISSYFSWILLWPSWLPPSFLPKFCQHLVCSFLFALKFFVSSQVSSSPQSFTFLNLPSWSPISSLTINPFVISLVKDSQIFLCFFEPTTFHDSLMYSNTTTTNTGLTMLLAMLLKFLNLCPYYAIMITTAKRQGLNVEHGVTFFDYFQPNQPHFRRSKPNFITFLWQNLGSPWVKL